MSEEGCPYCKKKPVVRVTCGGLECQMRRHKENMRVWWKKNGKVYNGLRGSRATPLDKQ